MWFKVDDSFYSNPKTAMLSDGAICKSQNDSSVKCDCKHSLYNPHIIWAVVFCQF